MNYLLVLVLAIIIAYTQAQTATLIRCTLGVLDYTVISRCLTFPPEVFHWNVAIVANPTSCASGYIELRKELFQSSANTRLTIPDSYYSNPDAVPTTTMTDLGRVGCIKPYSAAQHVFPNYNVITERVYYLYTTRNHYESFAYGTFDNHVPLLSSEYQFHETILGFSPPKKALTLVCQTNVASVISNYVFSTTSAINCPNVVAIGGHVWALDSTQTACRSDEVLLKTWKNDAGTASTIYRLALTAPSNAPYFAYNVGCIPASPTVNTSALYEFRKGSNTYRYAWGADDRERRINALFNQGYTELGAISSINIFPNQAIKKFRSCWDSYYTHRVYVAGNCEYYQLDEGQRFQAWTDSMFDTNLVKVYVHYNAAETSFTYTLSTTPPSGHTYYNAIFAVKSIQAEGTHPLYQYKRTGFASGTDTVLKVNNTNVPLGYTQYGGVLGYVYDAYNPAGCNPMYQNCNKEIRSCLGTSTQRTYMINSPTCSSGTSEGISFIALPCIGTNYDGIYGAGRQTFCRFTTGSPKTDVKILPCSSTPPSGYTLNSADLGCLASSTASGLVSVYPFTRTLPGGDIDTYYSTDSVALPGFTKGSRIGYGLLGDQFNEGN